MKFEYEIVDVFTDRQFGGNPLAVVPNASGLDSPQMQMIAAEFNLAETTFVLPPRDIAHTANVRIFTPRAELPFAGHPNVGTAFVLAKRGSANGCLASTKMVFEEIAGLVTMELLKEGSRFTGARLSSPQRIAIGETISSEVVAKACSLSPSDIETRNHHPCIASCGTPLLFAELKSREALRKARARETVFEEHFPRDRVTGIHLYVPVREQMVDIHSRMFAPLHGIQEDPATGAANVALIGLLAKLAPEKDIDLTKRIGQGFDMGRPSVLEALAIKRGYEVTETLIGGACVGIMRGVLELR
jgi:trans-2,3-dihydro-3-hydroxyanthranilate isomerase